MTACQGVQVTGPEGQEMPLVMMMMAAVGLGPKDPFLCTGGPLCTHTNPLAWVLPLPPFTDGKSKVHQVQELAPGTQLARGRAGLRTPAVWFKCSQKAKNVEENPE